MYLPFAAVDVAVVAVAAAAKSNAALGWKVLFNGILGLVLVAPAPFGARSPANSTCYVRAPFSPNSDLERGVITCGEATQVNGSYLAVVRRTSQSSHRGI